MSRTVKEGWVRALCASCMLTSMDAPQQGERTPASAAGGMRSSGRVSQRASSHLSSSSTIKSRLLLPPSSLLRFSLHFDLHPSFPPSIPIFHFSRFLSFSFPPSNLNKAPSVGFLIPEQNAAERPIRIQVRRLCRGQQLCYWSALRSKKTRLVPKSVWKGKQHFTNRFQLHRWKKPYNEAVNTSEKTDYHQLLCWSRDN